MSRQQATSNHHHSPLPSAPPIKERSQRLGTLAALHFLLLHTCSLLLIRPTALSLSQHMIICCRISACEPHVYGRLVHPSIHTYVPSNTRSFVLLLLLNARIVPCHGVYYSPSLPICLFPTCRMLVGYAGLCWCRLSILTHSRPVILYLICPSRTQLCQAKERGRLHKSIRAKLRLRVSLPMLEDHSIP